MKTLSQSPTDPAFVQDPYPFYDRARTGGDLFFWAEYGAVCAVSHAAVTTMLKDKRLGREVPSDIAAPVAAHTAPFYAVEAHSMLELDPPRHTRLRGHVLRAFTSRRITELEPDIAALCHGLIDAFPAGEFDLLDAYARTAPVVIIARLLGIPDHDAPLLQTYSNAMVAMYMSARTRDVEDRAVIATRDFAAHIRGTIAMKRTAPGDDLITHLLAVQDGGDLSQDELISTCILLMNAGHEATVHTLGNAVKTLLEYGARTADAKTVEEALRFDPPLHSFDRIAREDVTLFGHDFKRGDTVKCLLGAANRDPAAYTDPNRFDPARTGPVHAAFGGGIHFCVGAPLARLELRVALQVLFERCPKIALAGTPRYGDTYHFHGLETLRVTA